MNNFTKSILICTSYFLLSACVSKTTKPSATSVSTSNVHQQQDPSTDSLFECLVKISAHITLYGAEIFSTDDAEDLLKQFRTGVHDDLPTVYRVDSRATQELLEGTYYQELSDHLVKQMADWYGGAIPEDNGLFMQTNSFRVFGGKDFLSEIFDGIDMADIVGSMTYYVRLSTYKGEIYFQGINVMSFDSYAGENYFSVDWVDNPTSGSFRSTTQVFEWKQSIPSMYRTQ